MPGIKPISWRTFEKFVLYVGCSYERKKGDHRVYGRSGLARPIVFPEDKEIPLFVIRNNLRVLGISMKEYFSILEKL